VRSIISEIAGLRDHRYVQTRILSSGVLAFMSYRFRESGAQAFHAPPSPFLFGTDGGAEGHSERSRVAIASSAISMTIQVVMVCGRRSPLYLMQGTGVGATAQLLVIWAIRRWGGSKKGRGSIGARCGPRGGRFLSRPRQGTRSKKRSSCFGLGRRTAWFPHVGQRRADPGGSGPLSWCSAFVPGRAMRLARRQSEPKTISAGRTTRRSDPAGRHAPWPSARTGDRR
jgi:hypothetical protein